VARNKLVGPFDSCREGGDCHRQRIQPIALPTMKIRSGKLRPAQPTVFREHFEARLAVPQEDSERRIVPFWEVISRITGKGLVSGTAENGE